MANLQFFCSDFDVFFSASRIKTIVHFRVTTNKVDCLKLSLKVKINWSKFNQQLAQTNKHIVDKWTVVIDRYTGIENNTYTKRCKKSYTG